MGTRQVEQDNRGQRVTTAFSTAEICSRRAHVAQPSVCHGPVLMVHYQAAKWFLLEGSRAADVAQRGAWLGSDIAAAATIRAIVNYYESLGPINETKPESFVSFIFLFLLWPPCLF